MASHADIQDPLAGHPRYTKIRDLNRGSYGFVQLAYDKTTGMEVQSSSLICTLIAKGSVHYGMLRHDP